MRIKLSILIPAVFDRGYSNIFEQLANQTVANPSVEVLALFDNRHRSTGKKRQALLDTAQGGYIVCLDDDDGVSPFFCSKILDAVDREPSADVVVYNSQSSLNGEAPFIVRTGIEFENEQCSKGPDGMWRNITRKPWHWCAWSARLARKATFPDGYIDDDWYWVRQMLPHVKKQVRIDEVLHFYQYNSRTSLSQQGKSTT